MFRLSTAEAGLSHGTLDPRPHGGAGVKPCLLIPIYQHGSTIRGVIRSLAEFGAALLHRERRQRRRDVRGARRDRGGVRLGRGRAPRDEPRQGRRPPPRLPARSEPRLHARGPARRRRAARGGRCRALPRGRAQVPRRARPRPAPLRPERPEEPRLRAAPLTGSGLAGHALARGARPPVRVPLHPARAHARAHGPDRDGRPHGVRARAGGAAGLGGRPGREPRHAGALLPRRHLALRRALGRPAAGLALHATRARNAHARARAPGPPRASSPGEQRRDLGQRRPSAARSGRSARWPGSTAASGARSASRS